MGVGESGSAGTKTAGGAAAAEVGTKQEMPGDVETRGVCAKVIGSDEASFRCDGCKSKWRCVLGPESGRGETMWDRRGARLRALGGKMLTGWGNERDVSLIEF